MGSQELDTTEQLTLSLFTLGFRHWDFDNVPDYSHGELRLRTTDLEELPVVLGEPPVKV